MKPDAIVITGLGLACSLGLTPDQVFDAVIAGRSGLGPMTELEQRPIPDKGGGQAPPLPETDRPAAPREVQYLRHIVKQAMQGAQLSGVWRVGVVMGTTLHGMRAAGRWFRSGQISELRAFPAAAVLRAALDALGLDGPALSTCSACSSSLSAIGLAVTLLRSGECDAVIAGGYDAVSEYAYAGFDSLRLVASGPPRPFAAGRDGMKTAEGYAALVLERESSAIARGIQHRGYVAGIGESSDAHHLTQPHPEGRGAAAAATEALRLSGLHPRQVGLVSAHATATPNNDAAEFAALKTVLGDDLSNVPVVAFKSHLGHTLGGAGAVELVLSVLARERGIIPPTANATPRDPACEGLRLTESAIPRTPVAATLGLSLGFGGSNASIVVTSRKPAIQETLPDEAVITGVGVVLPGAVGNDQYCQHLRSGLPPRGGPVPEEEFGHLVSSRRTRRMSEYVKLTLAATTAACQQAGIDDSAAFAQHASVMLGTMHGSSNFCDSYYSQIVRDGIASANPALFAEGVPNAAAAQLSLMLGVRGACQTIIGSCTAGIDALGLAAMRIREGKWNRAFVGAGEEYCETVNRASVGCLNPAVPVAAGAVTFILESRKAALARNARILCTLLPASTSQPPVQPCGPRLPPFDLSPVEDSTQIAQAATASKRLVGSLPQCYSVSPMAALAAAILDPVAVFQQEAVHRSLAIQGSDALCGVRSITVRFERETG